MYESLKEYFITNLCTDIEDPRISKTKIIKFNK